MDHRYLQIITLDLNLLKY